MPMMRDAIYRQSNLHFAPTLFFQRRTPSTFSSRFLADVETTSCHRFTVQFVRSIAARFPQTFQGSAIGFTLHRWRAAPPLKPIPVFTMSIMAVLDDGAAMTTLKVGWLLKHFRSRAHFLNKIWRDGQFFFSWFSFPWRSNQRQFLKFYSKLVTSVSLFFWWSASKSHVEISIGQKRTCKCYALTHTENSAQKKQLEANDEVKRKDFICNVWKKKRENFEEGMRSGITTDTKLKMDRITNWYLSSRSFLFAIHVRLWNGPMNSHFDSV